MNIDISTHMCHIHLSVACLTTLPVAETAQCHLTGSSVNNEFERV